MVLFSVLSKKIKQSPNYAPFLLIKVHQVNKLESNKLINCFNIFVIFKTSAHSYKINCKSRGNNIKGI